MSKPCCVPKDEAAATVARTPPPPVARASGSAVPKHEWCPIPAGEFTMGNDGPDAVPGDGEGPTRRVRLDAYRIAATAVTNAQFAAFVRATRYVTDAENLGSSFVFYLQLPLAARQSARQAVAGLPWWLSVPHASWQRPEGSQSDIHTRPAHPVVHVSWNDAMAYCQWAGTRLPDEAQWERAARGGLEGRRFAWGDELRDNSGAPRCNVFRGQFPNAPEPGWQPSPIEAGAGERNGFGLFNVCGNVWEWCADPLEGDTGPLRGGSFLCHDSYCNRYRVAARSSNTATSSASNIGFRVVAS